MQRCSIEAPSSRVVWGRPPPRKKIIFKTSEIAFQAYFDQKFVLIDLWLYISTKCEIDNLQY
jgi:hypothetical protein